MSTSFDVIWKGLEPFDAVSPFLKCVVSCASYRWAESERRARARLDGVQLRIGKATGWQQWVCQKNGSTTITTGIWKLKPHKTT